jgi:hypothetical protein
VGCPIFIPKGIITQIKAPQYIIKVILYSFYGAIEIW